MGQFSDLIRQFNNDYENTLKKDNEDAYVRFSSLIDALSDSLREYAQEITADQISGLADKLKEDVPLTEADFVLLKDLIVGDAQSYIDEENNLQDWKNELKRLMGEIGKFSNENPEVKDILKLQALLRDADRVVDDLGFYSGQKDRIQKFKSAKENLTPEDRDLLFGILNTKLKSKYY